MEKPPDIDQWAFSEPKKAPFRIVPLESAVEHMAYVNKMVEELKALNMPGRVYSTEQAPSTQRLMAMTEDELIAYRARKLPTYAEAGVERDAELVHATVNKVSQKDAYLVNQARVSEKNRLGDAGEASSVNPFKVEMAVNAFMDTTPAPMTAWEDYRIYRGDLDVLAESPIRPKAGILSRLANAISSVLRPRQGDRDNHVSHRDIKK